MNGAKSPARMVKLTIVVYAQTECLSLQEIDWCSDDSYLYTRLARTQ